MRYILFSVALTLVCLLSNLANAKPLTLTFDEFPVNTAIEDQYEKLGIIFRSRHVYSRGYITNDSRFSSSPVLAMPYFGFSDRLGMTFVTSDLNYRLVKSVSFDFGMITSSVPYREYLDIGWANDLDETPRPANYIRIEKQGLSRVSISDPKGFTTIWLFGPAFGNEEFNWRIDNLTFDAVDSVSCDDKDKDTIIAEYKKSYGRDTFGNDIRIFDINLDPDGLKNGLLPESYFVPTCDMFTQRLRTAHYTFKQIKDGIGDCTPKHSWALIANALADTSESGRGLDRWAELIKADKKFRYNGKLITQKDYPKLNSAYRSPARQLSSCVGSKAYGSRHMFGDAVDLAIVGTDDKMRKAIALRWYDIGMLNAAVDWVESADNLPCTTKRKPGSRWPCAHGDWRHASDAFVSSALSKAKNIVMAGVAATTLSTASSASNASNDELKQAAALAYSLSWTDRAKAFAMLDLPDRRNSNKDELRNADSDMLMKRKRDVLVSILRAELPPNINTGEEEDEFFYSVIQAASIYASEEAAPLLLSAEVVSRGRAAWRAAARTGDAGVPLLLAQLANHKNEFYGKYLGVACTMRELKTVQNEGSRVKIDEALIGATMDSDWLYRSFAAKCLKWIPEERATPILNRLRAHDSNSFVREEAGRSLESFSMNKRQKR